MILLIPVLLIISVIFAVMAVFVAYSRHPVLGLAVICVVSTLIYIVIKWEQHRVERDHPPEY